MSVLLLRLRGPMQSWGDSSRFTRRETRAEPTKSGVLGLLAAAQGRRRADPVEDLAGLLFGVRVDQPGQVIRDFQTARSLDGKLTMPLSHRFYLSDAVFVAGVEGSPELIDGLAEAVRQPAYPLYLGRRSCPPSMPVFLDVVDGDLLSALRGAPWEAANWYRPRTSDPAVLPLVVDAAAAPHVASTETVRDLPVSYSPLRREYVWRDVARPEPVRVQNPQGRAGRDYLAALEA